MNYERYQAEHTLLTRKLGANIFRFMDMNTPNPYLIVGARTYRGNVYTLRIELNDFPNCIPPVFVTKILRDINGMALTGVDGSMHVLGSNGTGTRICPYGYASWTPKVSLYKVYIKCRLWLEMYELHLTTGNPIDYYLNHQA